MQGCGKVSFAVLLYRADTLPSAPQLPCCGITWCFFLHGEHNVRRYVGASVDLFTPGLKQNLFGCSDGVVEVNSSPVSRFSLSSKLFPVGVELYGVISWSVKKLKLISCWTIHLSIEVKILKCKTSSKIVFSNHTSQISPLPANRFWRARGPRFPSPLRQPRTTSLEEREEAKAAQRKWRFCWWIRKLSHTSPRSSVQSSEALAPIFSLAQHSRSCRTSSPLLIPSCSGKRFNWQYSHSTSFVNFWEEKQKCLYPSIVSTHYSRRPFCIYYRWQGTFACAAFWRHKG